MKSLLIRGGRVIDPASGFDGIRDVCIVNGKLTQGWRCDGPVFDAKGMVVAPGFIDMHVHLREPGIEHAETIESGSRAAAAGGFTSICCMPNTIPVNDNATVTSYIVERARNKAKVNVFPIGAITKGSKGEELAAIGSMKSAGIVAISDDGKPVMNSRVMRRAMEFDMHEGTHSTRLGLRGIPSSSEDVMVARDILLAETTGARFHVAHISTRRAVAMVAFAKSKGLPITCETTPHHFALTDADLESYDSNYKMKPPLRGHLDVDAIIDGIVSGAIDVIATDHAPHAGDEKMQEFERCPFGITGLETAVGLSLEKLVHANKITLSHMVALFTTGPAHVLKLDRGTLAEGAAGDVTIFDLDSQWTYNVSKSESKSKNSPFDNKVFRGGPVATIVAGEVVWQRPA
jgi:dihydroorotase